jgi:hypothetical protein
MKYVVLIIIYLILYFREDLSKMEYLVLIIIYLTLYFREDLSKMYRWTVKRVPIGNLMPSISTSFVICLIMNGTGE